MARRGFGFGGGFGNNGQAGADGFLGGLSMFLRIAGVSGGCSEPGYEGCIEVLAWSCGASNSVGAASVPLRVRQAKLAEKRALLAAVGLDEHGRKLPKKKDEKAADGGADAAMEQDEEEEEEEESHEVLQAKMEAALANFDERSDYAPFSNSEVVRAKGRPNCRDMSLTKYVDLSSAALMSMVLGGQQGQGVDAELLILRRRRKPQTEEQKEAEKAKAEAKKNKEKKGGDDDEEEEDDEDDEDDNIEYVPYITWQLSPAFITSVSTGGSGGEDRLTENVTLHFDGFTYKVVDWNKKSAAQRKQKKEKRLQDKQAAAGSSAAAAASSSSSAAASSSSESFERSVIFDKLRGKVIAQ